MRFERATDWETESRAGMYVALNMTKYFQAQKALSPLFQLPLILIRVRTVHTLEEDKGPCITFQLA